MRKYADTWDDAADLRWEPNSIDYREVAEVLRRLDARVAALEADNDKAHELADYYRNRLLKLGQRKDIKIVSPDC